MKKNTQKTTIIIRIITEIDYRFLEFQRFTIVKCLDLYATNMGYSSVRANFHEINQDVFNVSHIQWMLILLLDECVL